MNRKEDVLLKKVLEINQYMLNKSIRIIDDIYHQHKSEFEEVRGDYTEAQMIGLWKYYLLENYNKLQYQLDNKLVNRVQLNFADIKLGNINLPDPANTWDDLDYYYCLLNIDISFYNPVVRENFFRWLKDLEDSNKLMKYWKMQNLIDVIVLSSEGNKIIDLFKNLKINDYAKGMTTIQGEAQTLKLKLQQNNVELEKIQNLKAKLEGKLSKYKPKSKQDIDLIKYYIEISLKYEGVPSLELLASKEYSKTSWHYKLWDDIFLAYLHKTVERKLKNKKVSIQKKEIYSLIIKFIADRSDEIAINNSDNIGAVPKYKPDYIDNIENEIQKEFNELSS